MLNAIADGVVATATPGRRGICPSCESEVLAKCGSTVVWHWAHVTCKDCDEWHEPETEWHAAWKSRFGVTEKTIRKGDSWHRADAVTPAGVVVEFQHSTITSDEVAERERFYENMIWVLDANATFQQKRIGITHEKPEDGREFCRFRWLHRKRSFDKSVAPVFLDLGMAFLNVGEPFLRTNEWWDDSVLKDGVKRSPGVWQRTKHLPLLLEVKKRRDAHGWGRVISHEAFCARYGASSLVCSPPVDGLYRVPSAYEDWDGYWYCTNGNAPAIRYDGPYNWCKRQLEKGESR